MEKVRIADGFCLNKEGLHFEAKEAKEGIPEDAWDTYSAFANTDGGSGGRELDDHLIHQMAKQV